ncbi:MAG: hypothetical protein BGO31_16985 [Bacteroidetes bacterium 43-16]|nr:MAG: hypothetical protein BGO31_16985 [Bacteroidetes bacterium 43-16]
MATLEETTKSNRLLDMSIENFKAAVEGKRSKEEIEQLVNEANEAAKNIQCRESAFDTRVSNEMLHKPFEIVK